MLLPIFLRTVSKDKLYAHKMRKIRQEFIQKSDTIRKVVAYLVILLARNFQ